MKKVITYGTFDLMHHGHIRLLERAKNLGDYLIVGVTSDDFDKARGKINVQQSLMERIDAVRSTGIADEIIVEEYEGQKIDDIKRYDISIFTVGSDWRGKFDYLKEYCEVVYLERTTGVSSTDLRKQKHALSVGLAGNSVFLEKFIRESHFVNGVEIAGIYTDKYDVQNKFWKELDFVTNDYDYLLEKVDAVFIYTAPRERAELIKRALEKGKHVLCESPISLNEQECKNLFKLSEDKQCILMEAVKTAYATAYSRLLLLAKKGLIGDITSIDVTCTSLSNQKIFEDKASNIWGSIHKWGSTALLPIFQLLGTDYVQKQIICHVSNEEYYVDSFSKVDFIFPKAVASIKVGIGVKSEGELIISGTKGYIYVPAPWWKTDYFEIRYENQSENRRFFYQLDGEGIRYEIVAFVRAIEKGKADLCIAKEISYAITRLMEDFDNKATVIRI